MNYLILASSFNRFAGPNNHLLDLCNYLYGKLNVDLRLVTHKASFDPDFLKWINFPLLPVLEGSSPTPWTRLTFAPMNTRIIKKMIQHWELSPTEIFVNASIDTLFETYWAVNEKVTTGYNVLFTRPNSLFFRSLDRLAGKFAIGRILAHTKFHKRLYLKTGIEKQKITVIPHCIDLKRIQDSANQLNAKMATKQGSNPTILYGGRLTFDKGIKNLFACYQTVCESMPSTLVIQGKGPLKQWLLQQKNVIERRCNKAKIVFVPWESAETFLRQLANCTIFVLPSHSESFGIVILEAMSLKKPVITTRFRGPSEIITDGVNGLLVNPQDHREFTAAVLELLGSQKMRAEIGLKAFETVQRKYDVSKVAPQFIKFMEEED